MKIEQLLALSRNPHFKMSVEEQARLDDFLEKKQAKRSKKSAKKSSEKSGSSTRAAASKSSNKSSSKKSSKNYRVKNVVNKTVPEPEEIS